MFSETVQNTLILMGVGMVSIFTVTILIMLVVVLLNKLFNKK